jgi:hypothetical protein
MPERSGEVVMRTALWAQALVEHGMLSGMAAKVGSAFDAIEASFQSHPAVWLMAAAIGVLVLVRGRR